MTEKKKKVNIQDLATLVAILFLTAIIVGGGTWLFVNLGETSVAKTNDADTSFLQAQLLQLKTAVKAQEALAKNDVAVGASTTTTN